MFSSLRFSDRFEAGRELARRLTAERGEATVVVGKVGHPLQPEYAVGAVAPGGIAHVRDEVDEVVCVRESRSLGAAGFRYVHFDQVGDDEVIGLLGEAASRCAVAEGT